MNNPTTSLIQRSGDDDRKARQLALLASSAPTPDLHGLIVSTLFDGNVAIDAAGPALANDQVLSAALGRAAVYRFNQKNENPASDFIAITTASTAQEIFASLRRLGSAYIEVRPQLAGQIGRLEAASSQGGDGVSSEDIPLLRATFASVNSSYILMLNIVHGMLNKNEENRKILSPQFVELLKADPYLRQLAPAIESLQHAVSPDAKKMALREFFEIFRREVTQPTLYDEDFSALAQTILLREFRYIISSEARLSARDRLLGPYLAQLFESSIRAELAIALNPNDEPQPILQSFRDSPQEANQIMEQTLNYLRESSNGASNPLTIPRQDAIACEVLLSAGCLLPELQVTESLATRLLNTPDMNPALVLIFLSGLKFSLLSRNPHLSVDPRFLAQRGLDIAPLLNEEDLPRLFDEVLYPLSDDAIALCVVDTDMWTTLPDSLRTRIIEQILVRKIEKLSQQPDVIDVVAEESIQQLLLKQLGSQSSQSAVLHPIALRWLVDRACSGEVDQVWCGKLSRLLMNQPLRAQEIGATAEMQHTIRVRSGVSMIDFLAAEPSRREMFVDQVLALPSVSPADERRIATYALRAVVQPLSSALRKYDELLTERLDAEESSSTAKEIASSREGTKLEYERIRRWLPALERLLDDSDPYLDACNDLKECDDTIRRAQSAIEKRKGLTKRELRELDLRGDVATYERELSTAIATREKILDRKFSISTKNVPELHDYKCKVTSLREVMDLRLKVDGLQGVCEHLSSSVEQAGGRIQQAVTQIEKLRAEVDKLFALAMRLFESPIVKVIPLKSLEFPAEGAGARLGLIIRVNIQAKTVGDRSQDERMRIARRLEADAREGLQKAFSQYRDFDDTLLMLREFTKINETGSAVLQVWPEALSAQDTTVGYTVHEIPTDASLAEYLYQRLRSDIGNPETAWLTNERGWTEAFHAPLIALFGKTLGRTDVSLEMKRRALNAVFYATSFWVGQHATHNRKIVEAQREGGQGPESSPVVELQSLVVPWREFLRVSRGRGVRFAKNIEAITGVLVQQAVSDVRVASQSEINDLYLPLLKALESAANDKESALYQNRSHSEALKAALTERVHQINEIRSEQEEVATLALESARPAAPNAVGLNFDALTAVPQLGLPAPKQDIEGRVLQRISKKDS